MRFARYFSTWIGEHPGEAFGLAILLFALLIACLPLILSALPIRKVPLSYNLRNLQVRWLTTAVTGLVFTAGIGLLTGMPPFVTGLSPLTGGNRHPRHPPPPPQRPTPRRL